LHVQWEGILELDLKITSILPNNEMAKSNGECVEWGVKLANMMGREIASISEARTMLNTPLKQNA
jgi:uncharacterized protein (DUF849 family)